ncbi:patatin-like phospholipase domain containing 3 isoform X1 [Antennarius striatus]|uniref:patatin-like phospholipase domain containing 3 isoform X1 n=1 Tax=Antennarius striatus TaxID=241820 RepID=UPI0035ADD92D
MFDRNGAWNLSFAGCGFLGIYHIGVASCLLEKAPFLVQRAARLYGASAGALTASVLAGQASITQCCQDVIEVAKEARKRTLGPLHPSFNLVKVLRCGLDRDLPPDAHVLASGRLCVSLTRVSDGENVLVSEFNSREELIQALICSCFIPIYCGLIPPSFRGVRYVDGGISNNLPQSELKNTITISPFSGESDICPRDNSTSFHELRLTNTSIQMNLGNMYRLSRALFPPEPKVLAQMCQSGYKDALRFLEDNDLLLEHPTSGPAPPETPPHCCRHTETTKEWVFRRLRLLQKQHWWLDEHMVLPEPIKKVFCEACRDKSGLYTQLSGTLPVRVASYALLPYTLPVQSAYSVAQRLVEWIPEVPADVSWLVGVAAEVYRHSWKGAPAHAFSDPCLRTRLSDPPPAECQSSGQSAGPPALPTSHPHRDCWGAPTSTSSSSQHPPHVAPPPPVCFFVGSQDDPRGHAQL